MFDDCWHDFCDFKVAEAGEGDGGSGEEEVASEDGEFVAELMVDGGKGAAGCGFVDYVVMKEGGGVDHFGYFGEATLGFCNERSESYEN